MTQPMSQLNNQLANLNETNVAIGASLGVTAAVVAFKATGNPVLTALAALLGPAGAYYGAQTTIQQAHQTQQNE